MTILPKKLLVGLKRAASVSAIALVTNSTTNGAADLVPAPALPVSTLLVPKKPMQPVTLPRPTLL
jgi:hypothetical protein